MIRILKVESHLHWDETTLMIEQMTGLNTIVWNGGDLYLGSAVKPVQKAICMTTLLHLQTICMPLCERIKNDVVATILTGFCLFV